MTLTMICYYHQQFKETNQLDLMLARIKLPDSINGELSTNWFNLNVTVKYFHLRQLNITKIGTDAFKSKSFTGLRELQITDIPELTFSSGCFNGLENLRTLRFDNTKMCHFEKNVLASVPNLEIFAMTCNSKNLHILDNLLGTTTMEQLFQVKIFNCNLKNTITEATFAGLKKVIELNLNQNNIERFGERSLDVVLQTVHYLHLSFNKLTSLPVKLFENRRENFLLVTAHNNPWHCDATMRQLHRFIHSNENVVFSPIVCKTPPKCYGFHVEKSNSFCNETEVEVEVAGGGVVERTATASPVIKEEKEVERILTAAKEVQLLANAIKEPQQVSNVISQDSGESGTDIPDVENRNRFIQCNDDENNKNLTLSIKKFPSIRIKNDELEFDSTGASTDYQLVAIEETPQTNQRILSCLVGININERKMTNLDQHLKSNRKYRLCWIEKGIDTMAPFDCFILHFHLNEVDAWLLTKHKPVAIVMFISIVAMGFLIGIIGIFLLNEQYEKKKHSTIVDIANWQNEKQKDQTAKFHHF